MFLLFSLFFITIFTKECCKCSNNYVCDSSIFKNKTPFICCDGIWCECSTLTDGFSCQNTCLRCKLWFNPFYRVLIDESVINDCYFLNKNRKLYTEYLSLAIFEKGYFLKKIMHSSQVRHLDLVFWPAFDFDTNLSLGQSIITHIKYYNISENNYKCCLSFNKNSNQGSNFVEPAFNKKLCCGDGCNC